MRSARSSAGCKGNKNEYYVDPALKKLTDPALVNPKIEQKKTQKVYKYKVTIHCGKSYGRIVHQVPTKEDPGA